MSCSAQLCPRHLRLRRLRRQHPPPPPPASARCVGSLLDSDRLRTFFFCSDRGLRFTGRVRRTTNLRGGLVGHLPGEMPQRAIPGGLYSKLAVWDFSKERTLFSIDYGSPELQNGSSSCSAGQRFNPAFVHSIAVSEEGVLGGLYKVCAVARGDGALDAIDLKYELDPAKSKCPSRAAGSTVNSKRTDLGDAVIKLKGEGSILITQWVAIMQLCLLLNRAFSALGEKGKFLVSGGNDASVKLWDWSKGFSSETNSNGELFLDIDVKKKVNWLCTAPTDSDNLIVCDTSKVVKVYNFP